MHRQRVIVMYGLMQFNLNRYPKLDLHPEHFSLQVVMILNLILQGQLQMEKLSRTMNRNGRVKKWAHMAQDHTLLPVIFLHTIRHPMEISGSILQITIFYSDTTKTPLIIRHRLFIGARLLLRAIVLVGILYGTILLMNLWRMRSSTLQQIIRRH